MQSNRLTEKTFTLIEKNVDCVTRSNERFIVSLISPFILHSTPKETAHHPNADDNNKTDEQESPNLDHGKIA